MSALPHRCRFPGAIALAAAALLSSPSAAEDKITFDDHIAPIFRQRCGSCHNPTAKKADLDVTNYLNLMQGGASGTVIEAGDASASYLFSLVTREAEPFMPPNSDKIPDAEIELLQRWIDGGALENKGSKAAKPKAKIAMAAEIPTGERPEVVALPSRIVLEPFQTTELPPMARSIATSPWAPLAAVTGQRQVLLYKTDSLELVGVLPFPEGQPNTVRFSRDGALLLAGGGRPAASGKVVVWDVISGERIFEVGDELDAVLAADISADRSLVALGGPNRVVRVYSTTTGELKYELSKHTEWITALEFSPDGVLLATADRNGGVHIWEAHTGNEYLTLNGHTGAVTNLTWRGDSNLLATVSEDASVRLWEMENGAQVKTWNSHGGILSAEFARDGRLVTAGRDQIARLWNQEGKEEMATPALGEIAISVSFCDESGRLIAGTWAGRTPVFQTGQVAEIGEISTNPPTLETRLAAARALAEQTAAAHRSQADVRHAAEVQLSALAASLAESAKHVATLQEQYSRETTELAAATSQRDLNSAQRSELAGRLAQIQAATPLVSESLRLLTEAMPKLPNDEAVAAAHKQLTEKLAALEADGKNSIDRIAELDAALGASETSLQALTTQAESTKQELAAAEAVKGDLETRHAALLQEVEAARNAAQAAEAEALEASDAVKRWTEAIAFRDRMKELKESLAVAAQQAVERQGELDTVKERIAAAQAAGDAAEQKLLEAQRKSDEIAAEIRNLQGIE